MSFPCKTQMVNIYKVAATLSVISAILLSWLFIDNRFAHAAEAQKKHQYMYISMEQSLLNYQITDKTVQLNYLRSKKDASMTGGTSFTSYDQRLLEDLERDLTRFYHKKDNLSKLKNESIY